jgi:hypothetical protein
VRKYQEMMTPEAVALMREKLRSMTIEEFTRDPRLTRIYERYQKETGGTVDDFVILDKKSNLPNWSNLTANRLEAALEGLLVRMPWPNGSGKSAWKPSRHS